MSPSSETTLLQGHFFIEEGVTFLRGGLCVKEINNFFIKDLMLTLNMSDVILFMPEM